MSYDRFAAGVVTAGEPAKIRFYYSSDSLFTVVNLKSTYRANMAKNKDGESLIDDISLTQDEKDLMTQIATEAIYVIAGEIQKKIQDIPTSTLSIFANQTITTAGSVIVISFGFEIVDNTLYNISLINLLDQAIQNYLDYSILTAWYASCGLDSDMQINAAMGAKNLSIAKTIAFRLRKPLMT